MSCGTSWRPCRLATLCRVMPLPAQAGPHTLLLTRARLCAPACALASPTCSAGVDPFPLSANLFLALLGIDPTKQRRDMLVLVGFAVGHGVLAGVLLKLKTMRTKPAACSRDNSQLSMAKSSNKEGKFMPLA